MTQPSVSLEPTKGRTTQTCMSPARCLAMADQWGCLFKPATNPSVHDGSKSPCTDVVFTSDHQIIILEYFKCANCYTYTKTKVIVTRQIDLFLIFLNI